MTTATATTVSRIHTLSPNDVQSKLQRGEIVLVDVREPSEHAGERIPGATLMPLGSLEVSHIDGPAGPINVVFHCKAGGRSAKAAQRWLDAGHAEAWHLQGGIDAWKQAGLPIERDANAPISILRQVQIVAGSLVLIGSFLGWLVSPLFFLLSGFIGAGLLFAGLTDTCGMAMMLAKMPWNRTEIQTR